MYTSNMDATQGQIDYCENHNDEVSGDAMDMHAV